MTSFRVGSSDLRAKLRAVRLVVFDFDGVMTDNKVYVFQDGAEAVACWRSDGLGLRALRELGVGVFVLSMEKNPVVAARCNKLQIPFLQGCHEKATVVASLAKEQGLDLEELAYVGNDINDLECLQMVGLPIVVRDSHPSVIGAALWRTEAPGGRGAVREVCDAIQAHQTLNRNGA